MASFKESHPVKDCFNKLQGRWVATIQLVSYFIETGIALQTTNEL